MVSQHYRTQRCERENFIKECLNGDGKVIDSFIIDKGHKNGIERHELTENGIILIYNNNSNILVSKLIARPQQIKRYYDNTGREPPKECEKILELAHWYEVLGFNYI